jgi:hypothetical protein
MMLSPKSLAVVVQFSGIRPRRQRRYGRISGKKDRRVACQNEELAHLQDVQAGERVRNATAE